MMVMRILQKKKKKTRMRPLMMHSQLDHCLATRYVGMLLRINAEDNDMGGQRIARRPTQRIKSINQKSSGRRNTGPTKKLTRRHDTPEQKRRKRNRQNNAMKAHAQKRTYIDTSAAGERAKSSQAGGDNQSSFTTQDRNKPNA
eukprot:GHVU01118141.1.p1 GENE.GHVU01118141.1~~GHVU01118141.1.p1  ORF type:complete len:143 (-),score=18.07 GHVU01118141.1:379-807(-)